MLKVLKCFLLSNLKIWIIVQWVQLNIKWVKVVLKKPLAVSKAIMQQLLTSMICLLINKLFYVTIVFAEMVLVLRMPMHLIWNSIRRKLQINVAICRRQPTPVLSQMLESIYVKEELEKIPREFRTICAQNYYFWWYQQSCKSSHDYN